jgi:transcriptional regulator with GAF, ATPase, and Fis domain
MRPRAAARARRVPKRETEWDRPFAEAKETVVSNFEREYIESLMARTQGNLAESARLAGMDRANFRRLARRNDIDLDRLRVD